MTIQTQTVPGIERLTPQKPTPPSPYPPGATNANWFGLYNALSWSITLGAPLFLFANAQNASATTLGILASLATIMTIFQIPAARWVARIGYRRLSLIGWVTRSVLLFAIAALPISSEISTSTRLALLVAFIAAYTFLRSLTGTAWFPWITELIPAGVRGQFLSRDQAFAQIGAAGSLLISAACLAGQPGPLRYALVFLIGALVALISLIFLARVPDVSITDTMSHSSHRTPWKEMLLYPPFFRLCIFNVIWMIAIAGLGAFVIAFLSQAAHYSPSALLLCNATAVPGSLVMLWFTRTLTDRYGSILILRMSLIAFILMVIGWCLAATGTLGHHPLLISGLYILWGASGSVIVVALLRLAMATIPTMGRSHFFAIYSVIGSLASGLSPIAWGMLLDWIDAMTDGRNRGMANRFSIYFALITITLIITWLSLYMLKEPSDAASPVHRT